jgi:hypothetical protein
MTIEETGTVYDHVIEALSSPCSVRQFWPNNGWNTIAVPTGLGQVPAGFLLIPPLTDVAREIRIRPNGSTGADFLINRNAPFLWYFDSTTPPSNVDLSWAGQSFSNFAAAPSVNPNNYFTKASHGLVAGEVLRFTGGTPPTNFTLGLPYYVVNPQATTYQLAPTYGGAAITFTNVGASPLISTDNDFTIIWL